MQSNFTIPWAVLVTAGILFQTETAAHSAQYTAHLGQSTNIEVTVENPTSRPMVLTNVQTSCSCLNSLAFPAIVPPRGQGKLTLHYKPSSLGLHGYDIMLQAHEQTNTTLSIDIQVARYRDPRCYVDLKVLDTNADRKYLLVDVRYSAAYQKAHVPGSLNIAPYALKAKRFLRKAHVVLVDQGLGDYALEQTCRALKEQGCKSVHILQGGLNAWHRAGRTLTGSAAAIHDVSLAKPHDVAQALGSDWKIVMPLMPDLETINQSEPVFTLQGHPVQPIPYQNGQSFAALLEIAMQMKPASRKILIVDQDGSAYGKVRKALAGMDADIFYLQGGMTGWESYRITSKAVSAGIKRTVRHGATKRKRGCKGCSG